MGSRAVVIVCRDANVAADRFGVDNGETGAIYSRTGRALLQSRAETEDAIRRVRGAADSAGIWNTLDSGWLVLDCELLPWSAKALDLIRRQYASVGAAADVGLNASVATLEQAAARGLDVAGLIENERTRGQHVARYIEAYRRYVRPVNEVADLRLAPFHVLAAETGVFVDRNHAWHLDLCDQLVRANSEWLTTTRRLAVDVTDENSRLAAITWWEQLTANGGEGVVVKPASFTADGRRRLAQPGIKCRGREYLRIIYGPEYTDPGQINRLRTRNLGRKRSLAIREFALGVEGLERFVAREPLYRVHECAFGVLAMESEPVDPRL